MDGVDIAPLLANVDGKVNREVFCYYRGTELFAARLGKWKAHFFTQTGYGQPKPEPHDPPLLFNLDADPGESFECGAQHPDVIAKIKAAVEKHKAGVKPAKSQLIETVGRRKQAN
jgi:hypothetical protein